MLIFLPLKLSLGCNVDPRNLFCLIGIAVRIATRLGLHRDGARFGLFPFEAEQRKRTWWQLVILDKRIAEMTGSPITALSSCGSECRLPLNVNDSELHPDSKTPPNPSNGFTEMSFGLTRIELTLASAPGSIRPRPFEKKESQATPDPGSKSSPPPALDNLGDIANYSSYFNLTYIKHCDPKVPIQKLTMMAIKIGICKLHVVNFMCRGIAASKLEKCARDGLFIKAIEMLEYDDAIYTSDELRGFRWYTELQIPFPGYIFLASELVHRSSGELCERAWQAIFDNHDHRGLHRKLQSPMHRAFGHTLLKAWTSREQAQLHLGRENEPPKLITMLREVSSSDSNGNNAETENINADSIGPYIGTQSSSGFKNTFNVLGIPYIGDIDTGIEPNLFFSEQTDWMYFTQNGALEGPFGFDWPRST